MGKVKEIYKHNIYGVIATLVIHIIVLIILILFQLELKDPKPQDVIVLDLTELQPKLQEPEKEKKQLHGEMSKQQLLAGQNKLASNRAVNDAAKGSEKATSNDPFFDKAYNNEIAAAKKLVSDVNKTLARKIPEIGDIRMPVDNAEGKTREEVKQSNFKGKSNIHYSLENRYHALLPIPVYLAEGGGEVIVDIVVDREGKVLRAEPRQNPNISDMTVLAYAKQAAEKTLFNEDPKAPEKQKGTITYMFLAQ